MSGSTTESELLRVLQCNVRKAFDSHHELLNYFRMKPYDIAIVSEPYTGKENLVSNSPGLLLFQCATATSRVKACMFVKEGFGVPILQAQFCTPNLTVVELKLQQRRLLLISAYIEPDSDKISTLESIDLLLKKFHGAYILLGMDGNGKHQDWGCEESDSRGDSLSYLCA